MSVPFLHRASRAPSLAQLLAGVFRRVVGVVAVIALVTGGAGVYLTMWLWPEQSRMESGSRALAQSFQSMLDEETSLRAYLATGQQVFLQPYANAAAAIDAQDAVVVRDLSAEPELAQLVVTLRVAESAWVTSWARPAAEDRAGDAQLTAFLTSGKALFDDYRTAEGALSAAAGRRIDALEVTRRGLGGLTLGVSLTLAVATALLLMRDYRRVRRLVILPVAHARDAVEAIAAGDALPAGIGTCDLVELRELGNGIIALRESLVEERERVAEKDATATARSTHLQHILGMAREIGGSLNMRYVVESVASAAVRLGDYERVLVWLVADDELSLRLSHDTALGHGRPAERSVALGESLAGRAAQFGGLTRGAVDGSDGNRSGAFAVPLVVGARVIGVIEFHPARGAEGTDASLEMIETLSAQAAVAIEASRLHARANELAQVDPLTRLLNRRRLEDDLRVETARALRYGRPTAVVMLDLDHFKDINDTLGHQRADEVLQEIAALLQEHARGADTVYRYGGEELIVLARETTAEQAGLLAERFRSAIAERFTVAGAPTVTASFGVADVPGDATSEHSVVAQSDRALYEAKRRGRNRVVLARDLRAAEPNVPA